MIPLSVAGQMDKQMIANMVERLAPGKFVITVQSDLDGALAIQSGAAKYYVGACATGAGGALGLALGLLGPSVCVSISTPGGVMDDEQIRQQVRDGKKAFGFVNDHAERVLPSLLDEMIKQEA